MNWQVLERYNKALGEEYPNTLTCMDNLTLILQDQGKYKAAEEINWEKLD